MFVEVHETKCRRYGTDPDAVAATLERNGFTVEQLSPPTNREDPFRQGNSRVTSTYASGPFDSYPIVFRDPADCDSIEAPMWGGDRIYESKTVPPTNRDLHRSWSSWRLSQPSGSASDAGGR